jgi:pyruvate dehydrogenase E1 component beta subunit
MFIEHRWLYNITGVVPEPMYRVPLGEAKVFREGSDLTIVAVSYMVLEAFRAAETLAKEGIKAEVIDVRSLRPLDEKTILDSVRKTGRLIVADTGWESVGFSAEIVARASEKLHSELKAAPRRVGLPDCPTPTTPALANLYYPRAAHIVAIARQLMGQPERDESSSELQQTPLDVPDKTFMGPF